MYLSFIRMRHN